MSKLPKHLVHRCAPCGIDWPPVALYVVCARCEKYCVAADSAVEPDRKEAANLWKKCNDVREFDAKADEAAEKAATTPGATDMSGFEAMVALHPKYLAPLKNVTPPAQGGYPRA